ncbi:hypothetical protein Bca52824_080022 [Brassica carinata]|uniref:Reverse transcriptase zinc-binding domain-containing protein n=1 Tax=Brassica carinata TaxID=52824 RepID=A0A8X7Q0N9_BRACI|nr:hypothetical protein Bca52824_080022 [Brassica carinata]
MGSFMATVSETISGDSWSLPRGRHRIIQLIRACLPPTPPVLLASETDKFLWRNSPDTEPGQFVASRTWETLNPAPPPVTWHKSIWFKSRIPKHAFLAWVTILNRLPTRDRLLQWGSNVSASCLLCDVADESRDHLFFSCSFSHEIWNAFFSHSTFNPPTLFEAVISWLSSSSSNRKVKAICNLLVQALVYAIWKERNLRLHTSKTRPPHIIIKEVKGLIKAKLIGLDRAALKQVSQRPHQLSSTPESYLQLWFRHFDV